MRWIWTLAIACLVAASGVRPEIEIRADAATGQIDDARSATLEHLTRAPVAQQLPARPHAPVAILPVAPRVAAPARIRALAIAWSIHAPSSHVVPAHLARGPPLG